MGMMSPSNEETAETNTPATQREFLTIAQHMQQLQMELQQAKDNLSAREGQIKEWLQKSADLKQAVTERLKKKRRSEAAEGEDPTQKKSD